jgi:hypothetical protein
MTPKEAQTFCKALQKEVGGDFYVSIHVNCSLYGGDLPPLGGTIKAYHASKAVVDCNADDLRTLTDRMRASWDASLAVQRAERLKAMALSIIAITDETGGCTEAALRLAGYSAVEIATLADEATAKANEMAGRGPFSIERSANCNAPEAA